MCVASIKLFRRHEGDETIEGENDESIVKDRDRNLSDVESGYHSGSPTASLVVLVVPLKR